MSDCTVSSHLSPSTQSDSSVNFLVEKYNYCRNAHTKCKLLKQQHPATFPSRLLDIGTDVRSLIMLRDTTMFCDEEYACLSHSWGHVKPFTLNAETHPVLLTGIIMETLPRTFQDAILVTRRLQVRFLWIDSLYVSNTLRNCFGFCLVSQMYPSRQQA